MKPKISSPLARSFYFWTGIVATLAYRVVIVLTEVDPLWLKISWYIGTIGFVLYFIHRFQVSEHRFALIKENKLATKVAQSESITADDKEALNYILTSLSSSKERWNYIFIFISSGLALAYGIYLDFILPYLS